MRVLIWTASYPPDLGGLQTVVKQLADQLAEYGHKVLVISNHKGLFRREEIQKNGVKVVRIRHWSGFGLYDGWKAPLLSMADRLLGGRVEKELKDILNHFQPETINIHFPTVQLKYCKMLDEFNPVRKVVSLHGHDVTYWLKNQDEMVLPIRREINPWDKENFVNLGKLLASCDMVTTCSNWLFEMLTKVVDKTEIKNHLTTYNAIDIRRFENEILPSIEKDDYLFAFARLEKHKGFDILIEAVEKLQTDFPNLKLKIGGEGAQMKTLKTLISTKSLQNKVELLGRLSPEEVVSYAQQAKAIVIPSLREPFGITVLEAIASGKPIVASRIGGIPEAAGEHVALCEPNQVDDLADKITFIINNQVKTSISERRQHLKAFNLEAFYKRYARALGIDN